MDNIFVQHKRVVWTSTNYFLWWNCCPFFWKQSTQCSIRLNFCSFVFFFVGENNGTTIFGSIKNCEDISVSKQKQMFFRPITNARKIHSFLFSLMKGRYLSFFLFVLLGEKLSSQLNRQFQSEQVDALFWRFSSFSKRVFEFCCQLSLNKQLWQSWFVFGIFSVFVNFCLSCFLLTSQANTKHKIKSVIASNNNQSFRSTTNNTKKLVLFLITNQSLWVFFVESLKTTNTLTFVSCGSVNKTKKQQSTRSSQFWFFCCFVFVLFSSHNNESKWITSNSNQFFTISFFSQDCTRTGSFL